MELPLNSDLYTRQIIVVDPHLVGKQIFSDYNEPENLCRMFSHGVVAVATHGNSNGWLCHGFC